MYSEDRSHRHGEEITHLQEQVQVLQNLCKLPCDTILYNTSTPPSFSLHTQTHTGVHTLQHTQVCVCAHHVA